MMRHSLIAVLVPVVIGASVANVNVAATQEVVEEVNRAEADPASDCSAVCASLAKQLEGNVYTNANNRADYSNRLTSYWDKQEREVSPACFVLPEDATQLSAVVKTVTGAATPEPKDDSVRDDPSPVKSKERKKGGIWGWFKGWGSKKKHVTPTTSAKSGYGRTEAGTKQSPPVCSFAIRSGGHSPIKGWANVQAGVTIDMSNMKQLDVAADNSSVNIGPGNQWGDVYSKLDSLGLGTSGGRVATVGVGGLVTGGGVSFFSREKGLVADNAIEFEVVLSDGSIVVANQDSNPDLYRALKGGSGNFGIVTRIKMRVFNFPGGAMWGGTVFHKSDAATRQQLFSYFSNFTQSSTDVHGAWIHSWTFVNAVILKLWASTSNVHYTLPVNNPAVFVPVVDPSVSTSSGAKISTLTKLTEEIADLNPDGSRQLFASLTFQNSAAFMEQFFQLANQTVMGVQNTMGLKWSISYQSLPQSAYSKAAETGGNSLGLDEETKDLIFVLLTATWSLASDDNKIYAAARSLFTQGKQASVDAGVATSFVYLNYADKWQDPIGAYGQASLARLKEASAKYDRQQVFQIMVPGGFKIPATAARQPAPSPKWSEPQEQEEQDEEEHDPDQRSATE